MKSSDSRMNGESRAFLATNEKVAAAAADDEEWRGTFTIPDRYDDPLINISLLAECRAANKDLSVMMVAAVQSSIVGDILYRLIQLPP